MEYMPGGTLSQRTKQALLPPREAAAIVEQLAQAAHAAHEVGVLHRDIKPSNVLLDAEGQPKLTDFGLAKRLDDEESLTNTGSVLGTPGYMPPEQARGLRDLTPAADVYSLGATLFALLTGKPPFGGQDFNDTLQRVIHDEPPRPRSKRSRIAAMRRPRRWPRTWRAGSRALRPSPARRDSRSVPGGKCAATGVRWSWRRRCLSP
jgi:serine/threonine-protein kinase